MKIIKRTIKTTTIISTLLCGLLLGGCSTGWATFAMAAIAPTEHGINNLKDKHNKNKEIESSKLEE